MGLFRFRLENVLKHRLTERDRCREQLAEGYQALSLVEQEKERLEQDRSKL